jgi:hypothetical protein
MKSEAGWRPAVQWPCRVPAEMSDELERIRMYENDDKSGTIRHILRLGIDEWSRRERDAQVFGRHGLSLESVLPYLGARAGSTK